MGGDTFFCEMQGFVDVMMEHDRFHRNDFDKEKQQQKMRLEENLPLAEYFFFAWRQQ